MNGSAAKRGDIRGGASPHGRGLRRAQSGRTAPCRYRAVRSHRVPQMTRTAPVRGTETVSRGRCADGTVSANSANKIRVPNIIAACVYFVIAVCLIYRLAGRIESVSDFGFADVIPGSGTGYTAQNGAFGSYVPTTYVSFTCSMLGIDAEMAAPLTTVGQFVDSLGLGIDEDDMINYPRDEAIRAGMTISVDIIDTEVATRRAEVPYGIQKKFLQTIPEGSVNVLKSGQNGESIQTVRYVYKNGELYDTVVLEEDVIVSPVDQLVEEGSGGYVSIGGREYHYSYYRDVEATAYGGEEFTGNHTSSGKTVALGMIAVDPDVIPLGSRVYIVGEDGYNKYNGFYDAEDTGGAIIGDRIDIYTGEDIEVATQFGRRAMRVYVFD